MDEGSDDEDARKKKFKKEKDEEFKQRDAENAEDFVRLSNVVWKRV